MIFSSNITTPALTSNRPKNNPVKSAGFNPNQGVQKLSLSYPSMLLRPNQLASDQVVFRDRIYIDQQPHETMISPHIPVSLTPDQSEIDQALAILAHTKNQPEDEAYLRSLGINIIFHSGQEALNLIRSRGSQVVFGDMGDSKAHAQFLSDDNILMINQKYQGDYSQPTLYALASAIYHEAGHLAGKGDNDDSIQEELDCLALNTLAYRAHVTENPDYGKAVSNCRLIADGVALYPKLFFAPDPSKTALVKRVTEKYGDLPLSSPDHPIPYLSYSRIPLSILIWNNSMLTQARKTLSQVINPFQLQPITNATPFVRDEQFKLYYPDPFAGKENASAA